MIATIQPSRKDNQNNSNLLDSEKNFSLSQTSQTYTCSHCYAEFETELLYKEHYKSDLHKYNLKRRILDLNPVSEEQFNLWFNKEKSVTSATSNMLNCIPCGKQFSSKKTLNQHLQSKKHQEKMSAKQLNWKETQHLKDSESDTSASKLIDVKLSNEDPSICLFCDQRQTTINNNRKHMEKKHGFFILQEQFLNNLKGIILHYGQLINDELTCITCEAQFKSHEAVKKHMMDKSHCAMKNLTSSNSALIFYDFNKNPNIIEVSEEEEEEEKNNQEYKVLKKKKQSQDNKEQKNDKDVEAIKENVALDQSNEWEIYREQEHSDYDKLSDEQREELEEQKREEFHKYLDKIQQKVQIHQSGEIEIENGKVIGHRQFKQYYKQYFRDYEEFQKRCNLKMLEGVSADKFKLRTNQITLAIQAEPNEPNDDPEDPESIKKQKKKKAKAQRKLLKEGRLAQQAFNQNVEPSTQKRAQQRKTQVMV